MLVFVKIFANILELHACSNQLSGRNFLVSNFLSLALPGNPMHIGMEHRYTWEWNTDTHGNGIQTHIDVHCNHEHGEVSVGAEGQRLRFPTDGDGPDTPPSCHLPKLHSVII